MMIPSYRLIAEISLYSYGFEDTRACATKLVQCLSLSSEQLSSQDHYDFGMRTVKSIILAAGNLKRELPDEREQGLTLQAVSHVNLPKFTSEDRDLFKSILSDLFPETAMPEEANDLLLELLEDECVDAQLQPRPAFLAKCIEMYETIIVRHGLMLVGQTMAGKTKLRRCLKLALEKEDPRAYQQGIEPGLVNMATLNPKAVTLSELYGCFDALSHEWTDGLCAAFTPAPPPSLPTRP